MKTKKFGAVAAALLIGSAVLIAPTANASELVATDPSGVSSLPMRTTCSPALPHAATAS